MKFSGQNFNNLLVTGSGQKDRLHYAEMIAKSIHCLQQRDDAIACETCVNCRRITTNTHPNLSYIGPILGESGISVDNHRLDEYGATIKIEQIRRIIIEHQKANFENGLSIFIITHMHMVTKASANALLKVMEETSREKLFIALAPSRMAVLPTIASRLVCHLVKPTGEEFIIDQKAYERIVSITPLKPLSRFNNVCEFSIERDALFKEIDDLICTCHTLLRKQRIVANSALRLLEAFSKAQRSLQKHQNPRLVLENLVMHDWPMICAVVRHPKDVTPFGD